MLCWYLHDFVFWIRRRRSPVAATCRNYIRYIRFSIVLCASVGCCVVHKNNARSAQFQILRMIYIGVYKYSIYVIKGKNKILDGSKGIGSKVTQKRNTSVLNMHTSLP
jgi:hypothetical protein